VALPTAALIGWVLAERALAPIAEFAQAAEAIGRARDFSRRVIHRGPQDEVGHLAVTVNGMLAALEAAHRDLATAHARLEQALAAQQRFVADASHELRTPLTIIRANADILQWANADVLQWAEAGDPADRARALADIASETERMSGLVDRLLTLARADAGQRLALCPVPVRPLLEEADRQARLLATGQKVVLEAAEDVTVLANRDALKQLVLILIENALKYTSPGGQVRLVLHRDGDAAHLTVADTGMGIAPADVPRIFERFYRADDARGSSGSGLGLAIAQWIAAQHQARIVVTSTPAQGSTFTVILPAPLPRSSAPPDS
jgi:signal transduction histidine kinase